MGWGIDCPIDKGHGKLIPPKGTKAKWWCPHSAHGGNGKFFTDKEAHGEYQLKESDVTVVYEAAARDVIAGKTTLEHAVRATAEQTHLPTSQVREAITIMIETIEEKDTDMANKKAAANAAKQKATQAQKAGERRRKEHVDGPAFKALLDEFGLTSKQAAEATGAAGLGSSATYIYIVTHQGSSIDLFNKIKAAIAGYAKENKLKRVKIVVEPASEVEAEVEADLADMEEAHSDLVVELDEEVPLEELAADAEADESAAIAEALLAGATEVAVEA